MKKITTFLNILLAGLFLIGFIHNESRAQSSDGPSFEFKAENNRIQLDTMYLNTMNDEVKLEIKFENKGDKPLIINKVNGCCGTRITEWTEKPVLPGKEGIIEVQFRVPPRPHQINRTVKAVSNDPEGAKTLYIKGLVKEQDDGSLNLGNNN
ncbi:MAG: DUF1573 domain-containing protein [Bacteroidales bacterium]|nr:DUF1573 domain-containing protein [Bacteroidales bacterium]